MESESPLPHLHPPIAPRHPDPSLYPTFAPPHPETSPRTYNRRQFLRLLGRVAVGAAGVAIGAGVMEAKQGGRPVASPEEDKFDQLYSHSTILFAKPIDGQGWIISGGVLISPTVILTAARHTGIDTSFLYASGPDFGEEFTQKRFQSNISRVINHPEIDLTLLKLSHPLSAPSIPIETLDPNLPVTVARVGSLLFTSTHEQVKGVGSWHRTEGVWPENSSFITRIRAVGPGDSGGPVFQKGKVVGLVHGDQLFLGSIFVNMGPVKDWIMRNST